MLHNELKYKLKLNFDDAIDKTIKETEKSREKIRKAYIQNMFKKAAGIFLISLGILALIAVAAALIYGLVTAGMIGLLVVAFSALTWLVATVGVGAIVGGASLYEKGSTIDVLWGITAKLKAKFERFKELFALVDDPAQHQQHELQITQIGSAIDTLASQYGVEGLSAKAKLAEETLNLRVKEPLLALVKKEGARTSSLGMYGNTAVTKQKESDGAKEESQPLLTPG